MKTVKKSLNNKKLVKFTALTTVFNIYQSIKWRGNMPIIYVMPWKCKSLFSYRQSQFPVLKASDLSISPPQCLTDLWQSSEIDVQCCWNRRFSERILSTHAIFKATSELFFSAHKAALMAETDFSCIFSLHFRDTIWYRLVFHFFVLTTFWCHL